MDEPLRLTEAVPDMTRFRKKEAKEPKKDMTQFRAAIIAERLYHYTLYLVPSKVTFLSEAMSSLSSFFPVP